MGTIVPSDVKALLAVAASAHPGISHSREDLQSAELYQLFRLVKGLRQYAAPRKVILHADDREECR